MAKTKKFCFGGLLPTFYIMRINCGITPSATEEMESFFGFNGSYFDTIKGILIFPAGVPPLSGGGKIITPIV